MEPFGEKDEHLLMQANNTYLRRTTCGLRSRSRVNQAKGGRLEEGIGPPSHLPPGKVDCFGAVLICTCLHLCEVESVKGWSGD